MTPYQRHVQRWKDCTACGLCGRRKQVVLVRGVLPCDALFIGEAPGISEDVLGKPFVGPAGKLLDRIILAAWDAPPTCAFTNLVACFPREAKNDGTNEPPEDSIKRCAARLREIIKVAKPQLVITVGSLSERWVPHLPGLKRCTIIHPAAVLRMDVSRRSFAVQRCMTALQDAY